MRRFTVLALSAGLAPSLLFVAAEGSGPIALNAPAGRSAVRVMRSTLDLGAGAVSIER